jgi:hypothetical protein
MIQDDKREKKQIEIFGLTPSLKTRGNKYTPDATVDVDGKQFDIELKSYDGKRGRISTNRSLSIERIEQYRDLVWIVSEHRGGELTGKHYVFRGDAIDDFWDVLRTKVYEGPTKGKWAGQKLSNKALNELKLTGKFSDDEIRKLKELHDRGLRLNDPSIAVKKHLDNNKKVYKIQSEELKKVIKEHFV